MFHQVLKVTASKRTGDENFVTCMRHTLARHYGNEPVGLGGVFVIEKGKAKIHVMVSHYSIKLYEAYGHLSNSGKIRTSESARRLLMFMLINLFLLFRSIINVVICGFHFIALMHLTYLQRQVEQVLSFVTLTAKIFRNSTQDRR